MTLLLDRAAQQAALDLKRILIIDDEEPIRRLLGYLLQTHGYETVLASDAREARQRSEEQPFALILCDVNMPGESGMDLVRTITKDHPHTATIMVTGLDSSVLANAALEMGAFGYIIKPFESNEVLIDVANALRRRRLEMENRLHRENLEDVVRTRTMELNLILYSFETAEPQPQRVQTNEPFRVSLMVNIIFFKRRYVGIVKRLFRFPTGDDDVAFVEFQPHPAADVGLR